MKTKRDGLDVVIGWGLVLCVAGMLVCLSVLAPLAYLWVMGVTACVAITLGTAVVSGSLMTSGSFLDGMVAYYIMRAAFEVVGAILCGLAKASE